MRRPLRRRLFTLAAVVSAVPFVGVCVLWARSYRAADVVTANGPRLTRLCAGGGGVFVERLALVREVGSWRNPSAPVTRAEQNYAAWWQATAPPAARSGREWDWRDEPYAGRVALVRRAWGPDLNRALPRADAVDTVRQETFDNATGGRVAYRLVGRRVWVPYWFVAAAAAALPLARLAAAVRRRRRRSRLNLCPACGYDLRGADSDRCSECGAPRPVPTPAAAGAGLPRAATGRPPGRPAG